MKQLLAAAVLTCSALAFAGAPSTSSEELSTAAPKAKPAKVVRSRATGTSSSRAEKPAAPAESR